MLVTLTGPSGSGKTTVCRTLAARARSLGLSVAGLLTVRRVEGGRVQGLDVEDLTTGQRVALAEKDGEADGPTTGHWSFHRRGLEWGADRLARAAGADLLIVDELGPLELLRGEGWAKAVDALATGGRRLAVVVVRPELVDRFVEQSADRPAVLLAVTADTRDQLPDRLVSMLAGAR